MAMLLKYLYILSPIFGHFPPNRKKNFSNFGPKIQSVHVYCEINILKFQFNAASLS